MITILLLLSLTFPPPAHANELLSVDVNTMKNYVSAVAYAEGVDKHLALAIVETESKWNPNLNGDSGSSYGLFQIKCMAAKEVGFTGKCPSLLAYKTNILYGVKYLKMMVNKHGIKGGVAAYNAGRPIRLNGKYMNQRYVNTTMGHYYAFKKESKVKKKA